MIEIDVRSVSLRETVLSRALVLAVLMDRSVRFEGVGLAGLMRLRVVKELVETIAEAAVIEEGSDLVVYPGNGPSAGEYEFDLTRYEVEGRPTVPELWPLLIVLLSRAEGKSTLRLRGVTHGASLPGYAFVNSVLPALLEPLGYRSRTNLQRWGFSPGGEGLIQGTIEGKGSRFKPSGLTMDERGVLLDLQVTSAVGNLPVEILRRQTREASDLLLEAGYDPTVESVPAESHQPGTAVELTARYEEAAASFLTVGRPDKRAETVARGAVSDFLGFHRCEAPVSRTLAPQLLLPLLASPRRSVFRTEGVTRSLKETVSLTNYFPGRGVSLEAEVGEPGRIVVEATG